MDTARDQIRVYGDPVLKKLADEITEFDGKLHETAERMVLSLYENNGVGLAGPQVGLQQRIAVIDLSFGEEVDNILPIVNPVVLESDGEATMEEGCLSIPGIWEEVTRPDRIFVKYQDLDGNPHEREIEGYLARVIQHETDHLNGILFVDRISALKRQLISKQLKTLAEKGSLS